MAALPLQVVPAVLLIHAAHQHDVIRVDLDQEVEGPCLQGPLRGQTVHLALLLQPGELGPGDGGRSLSAFRGVVDRGLGRVHGLLGKVFHAVVPPAGAPLGIGGTGPGHRDADHGGQKRRPSLWRLPVYEISDAAFGVPLSEGQGHTGDPPATGGEAQQRGGVVRPDLFAQRMDHRLIAAHLHILSGQEERRPDQGIEPVDAQRREGQDLYDVVASADMVLLMPDDIGLLPPAQCGGKIDPGAEEAHHEGGGDVVRQIDIVPQRHGADQPAPYFEVGCHAVCGHGQDSQQPEPGGDGRRSLQRIGRRLFFPLGEDLVDGGTDGLHRELDLGVLRMDDVRRRILHRGGMGRSCPRGHVHQPQQGEAGGEGDWTQKAE